MGREEVNQGIQIGSRVRLRDMELEIERDFIVIDGSAPEPGPYPIPTESPLGTALLSRTTGEIVEVVVPSGAVRYRIQSVLAQDLRFSPTVSGRSSAVTPVRPVDTHTKEPQE
jgi:transcription elongation GreA/GreB family factor